MKAVIVRTVLGALGTVPARLSELIEKMKKEDIIGSLQIAVLISSTTILRKVLNL